MSNGVSLGKRVQRGVFAGGVGFAATFIQSALQVPVLLHFWGAASMGAWLSLSAVATLLTAGDLGHHGYVGTLLNLQHGDGTDRMKSTLGSALRVAMLVGMLPVIALSAIYFGLNLRSLLGIDPEVITESTAFWVILIQLLQWSYTFSLAGILSKLYVAKGEYARSAYWGVVFRLGSSLILLGSVALGQSMVAVALGQAAFCVLFHVVQFIDLGKRYPELFPWWQYGSLREGFRNYGRSLVLSFNNIGQQLLNQGLVILVSRVLGSGVVPVFVATRTMVNIAQTANGIFINPLTPELGRLDVERRGTVLIRLLCTALAVAAVACVFGLGLATWVAQPIFELWTGGRLPFDYLVMFGFILSLSFRLTGSSLQAYQVSTNDLTGQSAAIWANAALVVSLGLILMPWQGLFGLSLAMVVGEAVGSLFLPAFFSRQRFVRFQLPGSRQIAVSVCICAVGLLAVGSSAMVFSAHRLLVTLFTLLIGGGLAAYFWKLRSVPVDVPVSS